MAFETLPKKFEGSFFNFKAIGDQILGVYISGYEDVGDFGPRKNWVFKTDTGKVTVTGSKDFNDQIADCEVGALLRITYTGDKPSKRGNPLKLYKFEKDPTYVHDAADEEEGSYEEEEASEPLDEVKTAPVRKTLGSAPSTSRQARVNALVGKKTG